MKLTVSWPNPDHVLVRKAAVFAQLDSGPDLPMTVAGGQTTIFTSDVFPQTLRLRIDFVADISPNPTVLAIVQEFAVRPTAATPSRFFVVDADSPTPAVRAIGGLHPLLTSMVGRGSWRIVVNSHLVDVTAAVPKVVPLPGMTADMVAAANGSRVRVLARTDGVDPTFWITCSPKVCRRAPASDVLGFLTAPQGTPATNLAQQITTGSGPNGGLAARRAVFLGQGLDALVPGPAATGDRRAWFFDHFIAFGADLPNFILAHGWEQAVVDSGRHVVLALPVPAGGSHNEAGGPKLPGFLRDVHAVLQALGDITPPDGSAMDRARLGLGAHSLGADAAFAALRAVPRAFTDVMLIDPVTIGRNTDVFGLTPARLCLIGFSSSLTDTPFRKLAASPGIGPRLRLVPKGYPGDAPDKASIADIVARSPDPAALRNPRSLGHALSTISAPPSAWAPRRRVVTTGGPADERFEMLHQYASFGGDNQGSGPAERHFLTQALDGSTFR